MKAMRNVQGTVCSIAVLLLSLGASAQTQPEQLKQLRETKPPEEVRTFLLNNVTDMQDAEEILTDLRNAMPRAAVYYVASEGALTVRGTCGRHCAGRQDDL